MMSRHAHDVYHKYTWCIFGMLLPFLNEHTLWPQAQPEATLIIISYADSELQPDQNMIIG